MLSLRRPALPFWALFTLGGLGALAVFALRAASVLRCFHWDITEGREGPGIYAIWRILHGYPLYEWPNKPPYTLTLYNFGFYHFYAALMRLVGANDETLLIAPRFVTVLASLLGAVLFVRVAWSLAPARGVGGKLALAGLCAGVWFGTQLFAWWPLGIRPDLWAVLLAFAGVALVLRALASGSSLTFAAASLVFFSAWSMKQSAILSLAGSLAAVLLLTRQLRPLVSLAAPFAVLVALCLLLGGERYRISILAAPTVSRFRFSLLFEVLSRALPQNAWVFGFAAIALVSDARQGVRAAWEKRSVPERALLVVALVTVSLGALGVGREGANKNYLFDGYVVSALASWIALVRVVQDEPARQGLLGVGAVLLAPWTALPFAQLAWPGRLGRTELCTAADLPALNALSASVALLPKPLYADEDIYAQPWRSTGNRYPAVVLDGTTANISMREGFMPRNFLETWLAEQHFASALVRPGDPLIATWRARGGSCVDFPELVQGLPFVTCRLPNGAR